jgi:class 3 adenylate cyclase
MTGYDRLAPGTACVEGVWSCVAYSDNAPPSAVKPCQTPSVARKTVTVLFADVTGSTAMGEQLDPEVLRRVMTRYFDVSRATLEDRKSVV